MHERVAAITKELHHIEADRLKAERRHVEDQRFMLVRARMRLLSGHYLEAHSLIVSLIEQLEVQAHYLASLAQDAANTNTETSDG